MGVTFWGNFASGTLFSSISLAWHVPCASVQPGRDAVRARSCRNAARILDVVDPCEVLQIIISRVIMTATCMFLMVDLLGRLADCRVPIQPSSEKQVFHQGSGGCKRRRIGRHASRACPTCALGKCRSRVKPRSVSFEARLRRTPSG